MASRPNRLTRKPEPEEAAPPLRRSPPKTTSSGTRRQLDPLPAADDAEAAPPEPATDTEVPDTSDASTDATEATPPDTGRKPRKPREPKAATNGNGNGNGHPQSKVIVLAQLAQSVTDLAKSLDMNAGDVLNAIDAMLVASGDLAPPQ